MNKMPGWIVVSVKVEPDFWLLIRFFDGTVKRYDMKPVIAGGGIFKQIANESAFSQAYADGNKRKLVRRCGYSSGIVVL